MRRVLRPHATRRQREAFWRGWRLVALDGTQFSLTNTPQITATAAKSANASRAAPPSPSCGPWCSLEVGLHNPLAAAIGRHGESEWTLAQRLFAQLPKRALLLGDRLYGVAAFVVHARAACARVGSHFLLRASRSTKPRTITRLPDGTRLVQIALRARNHPTRILEWLEVREIRVLVGRPGHRAHELRLWTSLIDPRTAPALELAQLYAQRWEHELYFRELKCHVRKTDRFQSHTRRDGRPRNCGADLGQCRPRRRAAARRRRPVPGLAHQFHQNPRALPETDVAGISTSGHGILTEVCKSHESCSAAINACDDSSRPLDEPALVHGPSANPSRRGHGCSRLSRSPVRCNFNSCRDVDTKQFPKGIRL